MAAGAQAAKARLDLSRYQLTLDGKRVRLERQPMELLILFVRRKGQLVTREEIIASLWGKDVFVDADRSINSAVRKIRLALRDDPENPTHLETVVGKGYRFIGDIEIAEPSPLSVAHADAKAESAPVPMVARRSRRLIMISALAIILIAVAAWGWFYWRTRAGSSAGQIHSIAVLPLVNLSGDPGQDYFADGMTDELITELAQIGSLHVISRTSVMHYKGSSRPLPGIARELNVDGVVEGTVVRAGDRVRITAQLIEARADKHLWANSYEAESKDVLGMQDAVARDVVKQIRLRLTSEQEARLNRNRPVNPQAHEMYLKGRYYWNKRDRAGLEKAIEYFNQAIAVDPNYALPYAGLAQCYIPLAYYGYLPGTEARVKVAAALQKALELDDSLAEAHTALGSAKSYYDYDWPGAEKEFQRAIELNPNYATAHQWYGQLLSCEGRGEEALAEHRRALELDPLSLIIASGTAVRLYRLRRYDEAVASLKTVEQLDPNFPSTHWDLGFVYVQQKNFAAAITELQKANSLFHGNAITLGELGYAYGASGDKAEARRVLRQLQSLSAEQYVDPYAFALVYLGLKDEDRTFAWLEKAIADRDALVTFLNAEPKFDELRSDPRFEYLLHQMRLPH